MPDTVVVDVEARVVALVQSHRPQLAELVRQAVDAELERLVDAELRARNGNGATAPVETRATATTRRCNRCGRDLPPSSFDKGRGTCRRCRHEQHLQREQLRSAAAAADEELPRAAVTDG